jgi:RimJ/RimL family protein N-acetyltransferase
VTPLTTGRLRLVPATPDLIAGELKSAERLAEMFGAILPSDWPPEHHDTETLEFWRQQLCQPGAAEWWLYYVLLRSEKRWTLVGTVGYKGPPVDGVVEIGYSVVPSWQRRGVATEACRALIEAAWRRGAHVVVAHTLAHLQPSIDVLHKLGFAPSDSTEPGVLAFALQRSKGACAAWPHDRGPATHGEAK